jgi:hypothetical protein
MNPLYKIVWIDDQHEEFPQFVDEALYSGFQIKAFKTSRSGTEYLRQNLHDVDAVILDAKVFTESVDEVAGLGGLTASLAEILRISGENGRRNIPHLVFTGAPDLIDDQRFKEQMDGMGVAVFSKSGSNDEVFDALRRMIGESPSATIRNQYPAAYAACEWMGNSCWRMLFPILDSMRSGVKLMSDPYNDLRKVVEFAFRELHRAGIIHERLIENGIIVLQGCSLFLAGKEAKFSRGQEVIVKPKSMVVPKLVGDQLKFILDVCQVGSHTQSDEDVPKTKPSITEVEKWNLNHHLLEAATLMTLDFIVWAKAYVEANPNPAHNINNWEVISQTEAGEVLELEGVVISSSPGGDYYVRADVLESTGGRNIRIFRKILTADDLSIGVRVHVTTFGRIHSNTNSIEATAYRLL